MAMTAMASRVRGTMAMDTTDKRSTLAAGREGDADAMPCDEAHECANLNGGELHKRGWLALDCWLASRRRGAIPSAHGG
jgi:hypothetical protein